MIANTIAIAIYKLTRVEREGIAGVSYTIAVVVAVSVVPNSIVVCINSSVRSSGKVSSTSFVPVAIIIRICTIADSVAVGIR